MPLVAFSYRFSVLLPATCDEAFRWATDYRPDDLALMGENGTRRIERLAPGTLLLTDTVRSGRRAVTKSRLIRILPGRRRWTSTHLSGPARHSQFLYELLPAGRGRSRLEFTGLQVERRPARMSPAALARRARDVAREDAAGWRRLARAMARDLGRHRRR